ncbi:MAG: SDR family NAD(P)-dependent oxidoreductase [Candidatus Sumerlaeota bacterium]|nr:SDR family NAD(P)-dependent oxidoreductase [Candidatus Sumerlaeota bacterium]
MELQNRVALVTGAAIRVGRAIAQELAEAGAHIVLHHFRDVEAARQAAEQLGRAGARVFPVQADLTHSAQVAAMFDAVDKEFGRLDILVNNAGVFRRTPFPDLSEEDWDYHLNINLKGTFLCCREAARRMILRNEGKIVNIADVFGSHPWPGYLPYCVSKAGVVTLTQTLALTLAERNIQVNAIGPGAILFPEDYTPEHIEKTLARIPAHRAGSPRDVARTVRFLIEGPDYITGALINVDGGASLM